MVTTTIMTPNQMMFFFFKQKTAYEITASDWSSDVCSSDLYTGSGDEEVRFTNGSRILFGARERGFGRGIAGVEIGRASCRERVFAVV